MISITSKHYLSQTKSIRKSLDELEKLIKLNETPRNMQFGLHLLLLKIEERVNRAKAISV